MNKLLKGVAFVAFISFVSCKKEKDRVYDFNLRVNGAVVLLHQATCRLGPDTLNPAHTDFRLTAATFDSAKALTIDIHKNDVKLQSGQYISPGTGYTLLVNYYENLPGSIKNYSIGDAPGKGTSQYTVNITEINASYIKGTITGNYLTNKFSGNNETVEVADGEFLALRVY
jgi:hypothetical protein